MLSLDLFNSKYEKPLQEGGVSTVAEQAPENPEQSKYVANFNEFNTPENIAAVRDVWTRIQAHFMDEDSTWQWLTLKWPDGGEAVTLSPNQVFSILKKIASMSNQKQKVTLLTNFGNRNSFLSWLSGIKIVPRPVPKKDVPRGQQSFDLKEAEKKSSDNPKFKSTQLDRLKTQARAKYPSAGSDLEALAADFVDQQEQDQKSLAQVRGVNARQDDLIRQITALNKDQDQEIDSLASDEAQLQKNIQQLQAANATLAQKLSAMSQRRGKTTTDVIPGPTPSAVPAGPGVSIATDKQGSQRDQRLAQYVKRLRQQIKNLELQVALKAPQDQQAMRQDIDALKDQLAQLLKQPEQLAQPSLGTTTVGGQQADILNKPTPTSTSDQQGADDVDFTTIDPKIAAMLQGISTKSKAPAKKARKKKVAATVGEGSVFGQQDFDTQMNLAKLKTKLTQPKPAQGAPAAEPQPVPARLSDLQSRRKKFANLAGIKKEIETLQARATRGGRILPRGLAADLEDYFTTADVDRDYEEMLAKYQKQLGALQQYLGMRKVLWAPKKETHEMRARELEETKESPAWEEGGRAGYYGRPYNNPYKSGTDDHADYKRGYRDFRDEGKDYGIDKPKKSSSIDRDRDYLEDIDRSGQKMYKAQEAYMIVHNGRDIAFYKPSDIKQAYADAEELAKKHGGEVHVKKVMREGRAGFNPLRSRKDWLDVQEHLARLMNTPGMSYEDKQVIRQRYLEKQKEAQEKGFTK